MSHPLKWFETHFFFKHNQSVGFKVFNFFIALVLTVGIFYMAVTFKKNYLGALQFVILFYVFYTCGKDFFIVFGMLLIILNMRIYSHHIENYSFIFFAVTTTAFMYNMNKYLDFLKTEAYFFEEKEMEVMNDMATFVKKTNDIKTQTMALQARMDLYKRLGILSEQFITTQNKNQILKIVSNEIIGFIGSAPMDFAFLIYDEESGLFSQVKDESEDNPHVNTMEQYRKSEFDEWVLDNKFTLLIKDINDDFRFNRMEGEEVGFKSLLAVPLIETKKVIGILRFTSKVPNAFDMEDARLLNYLGDICSVALENCILYQKTKDLAVKDGLTGLYGRRYFIERLENEVKRGKELNATFSYLMMDIDRFKEFNDTYGHPAGDRVLQQLAEFFLTEIRSTNVVGRYGGEEFAVILPDTNMREARVVAERLREKCEKLTISIHNTDKISLTISIGGAEFSKEMKSSDIINAADAALYKVKHSGRNKVLFWEDIK